jgi:hypothetical protein
MLSGRNIADATSEDIVRLDAGAAVPRTSVRGPSFRASIFLAESTATG